MEEKTLGLIVAGSRTFSDYTLFSTVMDKMLKNYPPSRIHIISGGAKGADAMAERYAKTHGIGITVIPAKWDKYGKSAGYKRNEVMHDALKQVYKNRGCLCFWDGVSPGTKHNFQLAKARNTQLKVFNFKQKKFIKV